MATILQFPNRNERARRTNRLPAWAEAALSGIHFTGRACCANCSHIWVATAPAGVNVLKCSSCGELMGYWDNGGGRAA